MRILKRQKGNQEYYYIQYSQRIQGKVTTTEKYLGKEIPQNIEAIKQQLEREKMNETHIDLENIKKEFQQNWQKIPASVQEQELQHIAIAFTYNTNAIEGSTITLKETREILEDHLAPRKLLKDIRETQSHAKVFLNMLKNKQVINNELILQWHEQIFNETKSEIAGKYREYHVRVGIYRAPDWQDVKILMNDLLKQIKQLENSKNINQPQINPVEATAIIHYRFEKIHPFGDGNGRIGRLLMNYLLWHNQYPMLIIEKKKRRAYYNALEKSEEYFVKYFIRTYIKTHRENKIL